MDMWFAPTWLRQMSPLLHKTTLTTEYIRISFDYLNFMCMKHRLVKCNKLCGRPPQYAAAPPRPAPCKLTFDPLTVKVVSQSRVTWATSVPILVFL